MDRHNPYSEVYETLCELLATKAISPGAAARLSYAWHNLTQIGDAERALLCGWASVATLRLEHAIRADDPAKRRWVLNDLTAIFELWIAIPLAEAGLFEPHRLAA